MCHQTRAEFLSLGSTDVWGEVILLNSLKKGILQYSCLENPTNKSLAGYSPWGCKESNTNECLSTHNCLVLFIARYFGSTPGLYPQDASSTHHSTQSKMSLDITKHHMEGEKKNPQLKATSLEKNQYGKMKQIKSFTGDSNSKESANIGDPGSIPESGRPPGEGNGNPLQYSCLENPMHRGAWWVTVHGVATSQT